jgi:mannose-6-phosphate isomerase-like protein (cupin superfamily)
MKVSKIEDYYRGWYIGNFKPACLHTTEFEVGFLTHKKDEVWPPHIHKISTEINLLLEGEMIIQDKKITAGNIFILEPNEIADPIFLTDCKLVVIKTPSIPNDKYLIND